MKINTVKQIYPLVNQVFSEVLGREVVLREDLSDLVDYGTEIENLNNGVDNYVAAMLHTIGKIDFKDRVWGRRAPDVYKDAWEYGARREKVMMRPPEASRDPSWELQDGHSYDDNVFYAPMIEAKIWDKSAAYEIDMSFPYSNVVKGSLHSASDMARFITMIEVQIQNARRVQEDALIMRTINNFTAVTIRNEYTSGGGEYAQKTGVRAVNLLYMYNTATGKTLEKSKCFEDPDFLRYAARIMGNYVSYLGDPREMFNIEGYPNATPRDLLHVVLLHDFESAITANMQSTTFHDELVALPKHETVNFWQSPGNGTDIAEMSKIDIKASAPDEVTIGIDGIVGVMFDDNALGVTRQDDRITSKSNSVGEFYTNRYKYKLSYFNAFDENFVVFFVA